MNGRRPTNATPETPRQARLQLNRMEAWFRKNAGRYAPEDRLTLRALFEEAHTPAHAAALAEALRAWLGRDVPREAPADAA